MIRLTAVVLAACSALFAQQTTFRSGTTLVSIDVSVTIRGRPVGGLQAADFELRDNGVVQQIDVAAIETMPVDVTLVLDLGGRTVEHLDTFRQSAERVRAALRSDDRVRLLAVDGGVGELAPMQPAALRLPLDRITAGSFMTALYDAAFVALAWPVEPARRHLVVMFTDGFDTGSTLPRETLPELAGRADAVMHTVLSSGPPSSATGDGSSSARMQGGKWVEVVPSRRQSEDTIRRWNRSLGTLVEATGQTGGRMHSGTFTADTFAAILSEFRSSYVLRYTPRGVDPGGWHDVTVKVTRPGSFTIRARKGYAGLD